MKNRATEAGVALLAALGIACLSISEFAPIASASAGAGTARNFGQGAPDPGQRGPSQIVASAEIAVCEEIEGVTWFGAVREFPSFSGPCPAVLGGVYGGYLSPVDVDGDGRFDNVAPSRAVRIDGSALPSRPFLTRQVAHLDDVPPRLTLQSILPSDAIDAWVAANVPTEFGSVNAEMGGWQDLDDDGDPDLKLEVVSYDPVFLSRFIWVENIASRPSNLAADLNRDGRVDGADLGMLLVAWGPNP